MNGRYSLVVVVLLLGALVWGLSSFVGDMFSDDVREGMNAVAYSPSSWSHSASGGGASSVGNMPVLPMRNSKHSLFHHTAAVPAYNPMSHTSASEATPYYIYSPSVGAASYSGASAMSSADAFSLGGATEAHGVYLTSGATVQSYGGAMTGYASSSASGSVASGYSTPAGTVSSVPMMASSAPASSSVSAYSFSLNTRTATSPALMQSADQTLAARTSAPARSGVRKLPGLNGSGTGDEWINWFDWYVKQTDATGGWTETEETYYFTEDQLRAAYEYWKNTQSASMPLIHTYEDWLAWITGEGNTSRYQLTKLPIGDGVCVLVLLAAVYALGQFRKTYKLRNNTQTL